MVFAEKYLNDGERVVLDLHPHWWFMFKEITTLVVVFVLGVVVWVRVDNRFAEILVGIAILAALGWWVRAYLVWRSTEFVLTTDRLVFREGVVSKSGIEIPLDRINNVLFSQTVFERVLGAGDLVVESAGGSGRQEFHDMRKPSAIQNEINRQIEASRSRGFDRIASAHTGASAEASSSSVADELAKLEELRASGVLSNAEFEIQKARLLDG